MKAVKYISRILAMAACVGVIAMFFVNIVKIPTTVAADGQYLLSGFKLAFGFKLPTVGDSSIVLYRSSWYLFAFIMAALTAVFSLSQIKWKKGMVAALVTGIINAVMMFVFRFNTVGSFVDYRPITGINAPKAYLPAFNLLFGLSIAAVVLIVASILIADYVEVLESNGAKKTIIARIVGFFREYKSEIKKISWPTVKTVVKNTLVVLAVVAVVGVFIWLVDLGLGKLVEWIFTIKS
ncbi:MAG: preprotein translocase subunit SecE [Firmicutes bacterium]|nr:preprotein translocase subunit SecE [Bacillota bacterium]